MAYASVYYRGGIKISLDKAALIVVSAIIFFAPLSIGAVHPWSMAVFKGLIFLLGSIFIFKALKEEGSLLKSRPYNYVILLILLYISLQLLPLPYWLVKFLSPFRFNALYGGAEELGIGAVPSFIPFSMAVRSSREMFGLVLFYAIFFFSLQGFLQDRSSIKLVSRMVILSGFIVAVIAIAQKFSEAKGIYWSVPERRSFYGPFINPNHCAVFLGSCSLFTFIHFFKEESKTIKTALGFFLTMMILAVFYSLSRGGILSFMVPMALMILFIASSEPAKSWAAKTNYLAIICLAAAVGTFLAWWGTYKVVGELASIATSPSTMAFRLQLWRDTFEIFKDFFVLGTGFGTFADLIPAYRSFAGNVIIEVAENDWLELITTMGVAGFALVGIFVFYAIRRCARILSKGNSGTPRAQIGAIFALGAIAINSLLSFNLEIPGVMSGAIIFLAIISVSTKRFG